jgi:hypothetical protein
VNGKKEVQPMKARTFVLEFTTAPKLEGTEESRSVAPRTVDLDTSWM